MDEFVHDSRKLLDRCVDKEMKARLSDFHWLKNSFHLIKASVPAEDIKKVREWRLKMNEFMSKLDQRINGACELENLINSC